MGNKQSSKKKQQRIPLHEYQPVDLSKIKQCKSARESFRGNSRPTLIRQIANIQFPNLRQLVINLSEVANIEAFSFLQIPTLEQMELYGNHITSLRAIFKGNSFKNIKSIDFTRNPVHDLKCLSYSSYEDLIDYEMANTLVWDMRCIVKARVAKTKTLGEYVVMNVENKIVFIDLPRELMEMNSTLVRKIKKINVSIYCRHM